MTEREKLKQEALRTVLPKLVDIDANPETAIVPEDVHFQYVVASALTKKATEQNILARAKYLSRLREDIASMAAHDISHTNPSLSEIPELVALKRYEKSA